MRRGTAEKWKARLRRVPVRALLVLSFVGILGVCVGMLVVAYAMAGVIFDYKDTVGPDRLKSVDAVVVLAGARDRIRSGGDIWYLYWKKAKEAQERPPTLFLSGLGHWTDRKTVDPLLRPEVRQALLDSDLTLENQSTDTYQNAVWFKRFALQRGWTHFLLVTSSYHMRRARFLFEQVLEPPFQIEVWSIHQEKFLEKAWKNDPYSIRVTMSEFLKYAYYRMTL